MNYMFVQSAINYSFLSRKRLGLECRITFLKIAFILCIIFIIPKSVKAQIIFGTVEGLANSELWILGYENGKATKLHKTKSNENGDFAFTMPKKLNHGFYTVYNEKYLELDFIYLGNPIELKTAINKAISNAQFTNSPENSLYLQFYKERRQYQMLLNYIVQNRNTASIPDSIVYKLVETADNNFLKLSYKLMLENNNSLLQKYLKALAYPTPLIEMQENSLYQSYKQNIFLNMISDTAVLACDDLLNTPFLRYRYDLLYKNMLPTMNPQIRIDLSKKIFESLGFIDLQTFFIYYLLDEALEHEDVLLLSELKTWLNANEQTRVFETMVNKRMVQIRNLSVGAFFPDHRFLTIKGDSLRFSEMEGEQKLVIFYSSECSHCGDLLLQLSDTTVVQWNSAIKPVIVSIEESKLNWSQFLVKNKISFPGGIDNMALYNGTLEKYNIRYTPTIFLIDKDQKIIAKPKDLDDILKLLE